jgi:hypothetical protein
MPCNRDSVTPYVRNNQNRGDGNPFRRISGSMVSLVERLCKPSKRPSGFALAHNPGNQFGTLGEANFYDNLIKTCAMFRTESA